MNHEIKQSLRGEKKKAKNKSRNEEEIFFIVIKVKELVLLPALCTY